MLQRSVLDPLGLSEAEIDHLKKHQGRLRELAGKGRGYLRIQGESGETETIPLPSSFLRIVAEALSEISEGRAVEVTTAEEELTTQEAAELLNVSRPHLVKLLREKKIPHRKVGTHRRVRHRDALAYKQSMQVEAEEAMQKLADQAQELGLGYE